MNTNIESVRHGLIMALFALIGGALWAAYMATHHEQLHADFQAQEEKVQQAQMQHLMGDLSMESMQLGYSHQDNSTHRHESSHDAAGHAVGDQHSHSGSLATDAMQRLLRGHIHFMGLGVLTAILLIITAFTSLKKYWKKTLGWTFGIGALAYPPAWILMGFRTVEMGPAGAEESVMWLFAPAVGLLLSSMGGLLVVMIIEMVRGNEKPIFRFLFESDHKNDSA